MTVPTPKPDIVERLRRLSVVRGALDMLELQMKTIQSLRSDAARLRSTACPHCGHREVMG